MAYNSNTTGCYDCDPCTSTPKKACGCTTPCGCTPITASVGSSAQPLLPCWTVNLCEGCEETIDSSCVIYDGPEVECLLASVQPGMNLTQILQAIFDTLCYIKEHCCSEVPIEPCTLQIVSVEKQDNQLTATVMGSGVYVFEWCFVDAATAVSINTVTSYPCISVPVGITLTQVDAGNTSVLTLNYDDTNTLLIGTYKLQLKVTDTVGMCSRWAVTQFDIESEPCGLIISDITIT